FFILCFQARRAEIKVAVTMVNHNVPLAVADHFSPLMKECFKDSDVAQRYGAARTKTTCIINRAIAPYLHDELVKKMRNRPYTLSTDGSNDTGREKMNPLTVKLFDVDRVEHMFLDMCITTGTNAATAETIFEKMDSVLRKDNIPWQNCVGLSVDNANVNMGVCNSIKSRILSINLTVYVHGCPCHIVHNSASAAGTHYIELSDFDVEDVVVDIGYWFKASTKRKCRLDEFCVFCDTEYMAVIVHVSTRWLSLETAVVRILRLYQALVSCFKSNKRVFSMIGLNKTDIRNALALEGTLSSIMTIKMSGMEPNCFKYEPPAEVIKASKSAASSYNREHAAASNAGSECT
ncbi:hypothetical protein HHUSO_G36086, partial [Huso huso]